MTGKRRCWPDGTPAKFSKTEPCPCYLADTRKHQHNKMPRGPHPEREKAENEVPQKPKGLKAGEEPSYGYRSGWDVAEGKKMYLAGCSNAEIAEKLGTTPAAVRSCAIRYNWKPEVKGGRKT
jgi:hypothetical protein